MARLRGSAGGFYLAVFSGRGVMKALMMSGMNENSASNIGRVEFGKELARIGRLTRNLLLRIRFWIIRVTGAGRGEIMPVVAAKANTFSIFAALQTK